MTTIVSSLDTERLQDIEKWCATGQELLPGLPNHVGLHHILPKLRWRDSYILSSVNRGWRQAGRLRMLYDERVRARTTSAFVLVSFTPTIYDRVLALYSMRDNSWIELPPIPHVDGGSTWCSELVSLKGKIYVIGGGLAGVGEPSTNRVCVLDLAASKHWQNCASMKQPRASLGSAVFNGKIYVFGGMSSLQQPVQGSEVYDPEDDSWSSVMPMPTHSTFSERVTSMGEQIILQGGWPMVDPNSYMSIVNPLMGRKYRKQIFGDVKVVYHTRKDEWRTGLPHRTLFREALFSVEDKLYSIDPWGIHVLNDAGNLWNRVHSFTLAVCLRAYCHLCVAARCPLCPVCGKLHCDMVVPTAVLPVDDELVAILIVRIRPKRVDLDYSVEYCMVRSKGFRKKNVKISWQKVEVPQSFADPKCWYQTHSMCSIHL